MIHIEQGQTIPENENLRVASQTGDYEDGAFIEFYDVKDPDIIAGAFHAQFVKYGGLVYRFNDPKELGAEILKLDRESTHSAASFIRMQNELLSKLNEGSLEPESLNQVISNEQINMEEKIEELNREKESELVNEEVNEGETDMGLETVTEIDEKDSSTTSTTTIEEIIPEITEPVIEIPVAETPTIIPDIEESVIVPEIPVIDNTTTLPIEEVVKKLKNKRKIA